ncbi:MAG: hypothetical protein K2W85_13155 [Phycisphaerales bacterium]|nr:hypothetical protein [Phycisphaerales bacterium]
MSSANVVLRADSIGAGKLSFKRVSDEGSLVGTSLRLRVCYSTLAGGADVFPAPVVHPVLRVFGGTLASPTGSPNFLPRSPLRNAAGEASVLMRLTPAEDAIVRYGAVDYHATTPDNAAHTWDCDGCNVFIVAVERAFAVGFEEYDYWNAFVQAKIV